MGRVKSLLLLAALAALVSLSAPAEDAADIGGRLEPFFDRWLVGSLDGASHVLHEFHPAGTAITFDAPWEGRYCGYVTVFKDGPLYRMYYRGLPEPNKDGSDTEVTCYAESADGIRWTKPELGLFEVNGSTANNVILAGQAPYSHNFSPFLDARPGVPDSEKYKALAGTSEKGLAAFASADGVRWRMVKPAVITKGAFDSQNVAFWSAAEQCYLCYFRTWTEGDWGGARWVSRTTSQDFLNWTEPVRMDKGDAPWENIYTNETLPYFRAPHLYVSVAARFMPGRRVVPKDEAAALGIQGGYADDCSDSVLMTSRGGNRYDRTFMEGLIKPGIGYENWTSRSNYPAYGIVPTGEREMSLYIQANYGQPTAHLVRYAIRPDGLASIRAPYTGGEMTTRPLTFAGKRLRLNYATSAAGSVRVEVQDAAGAPLPGFAAGDCPEIIGNFLDREVRWNGGADLSALAGTPVRLRFVMKDADLFAIQFTE